MRDNKVVYIFDHTEKAAALEAAGLSEQAMSQENVETLHAVHKAVSQGDFETLLPHLHPEVVVEPAFGGQLDFKSSYRGRDGMREFMEMAWKDFGITVEVEEMVNAPNDRILATERWHMRARDGIETDVQITDVYTFENGLIVRVVGFREKADALEAVGLSE